MTPQQIDAMKLALEAMKNNKRTHLYCEDIWYSCPKHEDGCANEAEGDECNCGADEINAEFDKAITAIEEALAEHAIEEALAEHAMREVQRLGQEIEQEPEEHRLLRRKWFGHRDTGHLSFTEAVDVTMEKIYSQPKQEPVAWMDVDGNVSDNNDHKCFPIPLYTQPPQRTEQEPEQEPVGVVHHKKITSMIGADYEQVAVFFRPVEPLTQLYTNPPQRKPLTDKAITKVIDSMPKKMKGFMVDWDLYEFARAIEAAHGIKENT